MIGQSFSALILCLGLALLSGCTAPIDRSDAQVTIRDSEFDQQVALIGPADRVLDASWHLQSYVTKSSGRVSHQLVAQILYSGSPRGYFAASDDTARPLRVDLRTKPSNKLSAQIEDVAVEIPDAVLRQRAESGMRIRILAKTGDGTILPISAKMIGLQLAAVDQVPQRKAAATAPPEAADESPPAAANMDALFARADAQAAKMAAMIGDAQRRVLGMNLVVLSSAQRLLVVAVQPGSAGERAGFETGDMLVSCEGVALTDREALDNLLLKHGPGSAITFEIERHSQRTTVTARL